MIKAILTGHSKGLGLGIASALLSRGHPVLCLSRNRNSELQKQFPTLLHEVETDLSRSEALQDVQLLEALQDHAADATSLLLINNAGMVAPVGPLSSQDPTAINKAVQLNIAAPLILSAMLSSLLKPTQALRILHVSSGAGRSAYPGWAVYCATKAALDMHAQAVAADNIPNVKICSLAPGVIDTDMQAEIRLVDSALFPNKARFQQLKAEGQLSQPKEAGKQLVKFLLSDQFGKVIIDDLRQHRS